jgi:hypothetical protein
MNEKKIERTVSIQHEGKVWECVVEPTGLFAITVDGVEGHDGYVDESGVLIPFDIVEGNEDEAFEGLRLALAA